MKVKVKNRNKDKSILDKLKAIDTAAAKTKAKKKMPGKVAGAKVGAKKRGKSA
jgi:hypothetical protein